MLGMRRSPSWSLRLGDSTQGGIALSNARAAHLALNGGTPVRTRPWPPRGLIGPEEKAAVDAYLDEIIASGQAIGYGGAPEQEYCREFAEYLGGGFADAVNSGTAALYVALKALGIEPFTEVIVTAVTDPGGLMPVPLLNLIPVIADSLPGAYNSGPEQITEVLSPLTSAIVVAHIGGEPADMEGITALARERGLPVIEDCSQAHGARLYGQPVGTFGEVAVFSTMWGKHHSTGGQGGVVFSRNEELYGRIQRAADRGKPLGLPPGSTNCVASLNFNFNDLAAVIGRVQLRRLPSIVARRQEVVAPILEAVRQLPTLAAPEVLPTAEPSWWFLRIAFRAENATCDKATFCQALIAEGLPINPDYSAALPHRMQWFRERRVFGSSGYPWCSPDYRGDRDREFPCPNAVGTVATTFNLHLHENWGEAEIADAIAILEKVDGAFRKG